jgi:hypothetical protein
MYLVILRGVLLVVFVTTMLMGSVTDVFLPLMMSSIAMKGRSLFMIIIVVVLFL